MALDLSTSTGIAFDLPGRDAPLLETLRLPKPPDPDDFGVRYAALAGAIRDRIAVHGLKALAYEAPIMTGKGVVMNRRTAQLLIGLTAIVELVAHEAGIPVYMEEVSTVRKHFCGNGRADKPAVMARCRTLGWAARNDNEADAAALCDYVRHTLRADRRLGAAALQHWGQAG